LAITSAAAIGRIRRRLPGVRVGHAGTLDPLATGLLVLLLGTATKLSDRAMAGDKDYVATVRFGYATLGDDREGRPIAAGHCNGLDVECVGRVLQSFVGERWQRPPDFCAKKVRGVPRYRLARRGMAAPGEPERIHIHRIRLLRWSSPLLQFSLSCGKGTYVRSIARDLGEELHCYAHLHALRRTGSGDFSIGGALPLSVLESLPLEELRALAAATVKLLSA
jgi:tRNA pseudouridine55 synthase